MALIGITPTQVKAKASELRNLNAQFKTKAEGLQSSEEVLAGKWEGDAKAAFRTSFQNDKAKMDHFYNVIEQYCTTLENIAIEMQNADAKAAGIASSRG